MPGVREAPPHHRQPWDNRAFHSGSFPYSNSSIHSSDMMPYRGDHHSNGYASDQQSHVSASVGDDGSYSAPTYVMEHLATFTVSKETGIVYPADGMRRLLQLEKSNGIWSQKMQMRLERSLVMIMDYESGAVMERFPVALIQEPTAFTSHDPMEIYNNILVFIVGEEGIGQRQGRSEMHIFQCQSISGQDLVEDLKLLRAGKMPPSRRRSHLIPPPPATPPPDPPINGINVREQVNVFNAAAHHSEVHGELGAMRAGAVAAGASTMYRESTGSVNDETSSTSSEKYERDVTILNHCFDDIEKFIARLQHAAAASRELERRRRNRKSKKKDLGDGMLTMRAKPPPEMEFVDIFQKFKLSFNLLAKLKAHIHDPNAPELVHFLFTPLALIVDASHDCTHYGPNLPAKVVSPLLTRDAYNLLINCVTSKETELWHSLGDAWLVPKDQWKGYVAPYHPMFMDGWSPDYPVTEERELHASTLGTVVALEAKRQRGEEIRAAQHEAELREQHYRERDDSHYSSDYFDYDRQEPSPPEATRYAYENRNYGARQERYSREERERSQTPPSERDFPNRDVSSRSDISADSIERNGGGGMGEQQQRFERAQHHWLEELRGRNAKIVQVTYPRTANNDKELTVIRGEYLEVLDDTRKWWKARNSRNQVAHVPHTIVTPHLEPGSGGDVFNNPLYSARGYGPESPRESVSTNNDLGRAPARSPPRIGKKAIVSPAGPPRRNSPADPPRRNSPAGPPRRNSPAGPPRRNSPAGRPRRNSPAGRHRRNSRGSSEFSSDDDGLPIRRNSSNVTRKPVISNAGGGGMNGGTPVPPPMPPPAAQVKPKQVVQEKKKYNSQSRSTLSHTELMQEELQAVLDELREQQRHLDIQKTPEVYITQKSNPEEVQSWLEAKGFSEKIRRQFSTMNGNEILALKRHQLKQICGPKEGIRLDSQLTIQRNVSGYKTARSTELRAILARARQKAEGLQRRDSEEALNNQEAETNNEHQYN